MTSFKISICLLFLFFAQWFSYIPKKSLFTFKISLLAKMLQKLPNLFNPLLHRYSFRCINNRQLLETLWEKEKLLVTSNFFLSHKVFYSDTFVSPLFYIFDITCISLFAAEFEEPRICLSAKGLTF